MADAPAKPAGKGLDALTHKVGPLPVWAYAAIAVGIWYWYTHYGPGAKVAAAAVGASGTGSPGGIGSNEITTALYADDAAWGAAAISYLGGIGIPGKQATVEIDNYLRGLPNTAQGQSDVQLALNSIGPPPVTPPDSTGGTPPPPPGPAGQCKPGYTFVAGVPVDLPVGAYSVSGGYCTKDSAGGRPPPPPGPGPHPKPLPWPPKPKHPNPGGPERDKDARQDKRQEAEKDRDQRERHRDRDRRAA